MIMMEIIAKYESNLSDLPKVIIDKIVIGKR